MIRTRSTVPIYDKVDGKNVTDVEVSVESDACVCAFVHINISVNGKTHSATVAGRDLISAIENAMHTNRYG